jgi:hypothetical protein
MAADEGSLRLADEVVVVDRPAVERELGALLERQLVGPARLVVEKDQVSREELAAQGLRARISACQ